MNAELFNVRLVIILLGLITVVALVFAGILSYEEKDVPEFLVITIGGGMAALGAMLSKTSAQPDEVRISNRTNDPVPTTDQELV